MGVCVGVCVCVGVGGCVCARALSRSVMYDSFAMPQTGARQAPLSMGLPRRKYWSGLPCPPLGYLPDPRIEPASPAAPAMTRGFFTTEPLWKPLQYDYSLNNKLCNVPHSKWERLGH